MPDGNPSGAMQRRVEGALALGRMSPDPFYVVTGGASGGGPAEADVMKVELRRRGVPEERIVTEAASRDTLSSIVNCARLVRGYRVADAVYVCSDRYHIPRCRWLFWLLGIRTRPVIMPSGRSAIGNLRWTCYYVREAAAMPVDTVLLLAHRLIRAGDSLGCVCS